MEKNFKRALTLFVTCASLLGFASCKTSNKTSEVDPNDPSNYIDYLPETFDHYYSDKITFADMGITLPEKVEDQKFMENKVARLKLKSVTDGDTAVFYLNGEMDSYTNPLGREYGYLTVRFLAIDTPESTSSIAPWGKKASKFVKNKLENAEGIIVDATSIDTSNEDRYPNVQSTYISGCRLDSNGSRWLGMVWYCPDGMDANNYRNYRSLQLDVIEECYSYYTGSLGDTNYCYFANEVSEPKLYGRYAKNEDGSDRFGSLRLGDVLFEAEYRMTTLKRRYTGSEIDESYDYSKEPFRFADRKASIKDAVDHFEEYSNSGKFLAITGVITGFIGCNFYFEDATGTPLYVYMGINAKSIESMFKVGDTIELRGRLAEYGGQMQVSDVVFKKETFTKITNEADKISLPDYIEVSSSNMKDTELKKYLGKRVKMTFTTANRGNQSKDKSFTLNTNNAVTYYDEKGQVISGVQYPNMGIRFNGTLAPEYTFDDIEAFCNKTVVVKGIMSIFMEMDLQNPKNVPSYQITMVNRPLIANSDGSYTPGWDIELA